MDAYKDNQLFSNESLVVFYRMVVKFALIGLKAVGEKG